MRRKCQFCLVFVGLLRNISSVICWVLLVDSWPTPAMLALLFSSAYHLYGNFGENFPSNGTANFFASKQELDWIVPFTKYQQIFRFLSRGILALVIQTNGTENFGCSSKSGRKLIPRKVSPFFAKHSTSMNLSTWILPGSSYVSANITGFRHR